MLYRFLLSTIWFFIFCFLFIELAYGIDDYSASRCSEQKGYMRCFDGYYKTIDGLDPKTKAPTFAGEIKRLDDLDTLSFYFKKSTYYLNKSNIQKAMRYEYYDKGIRRGAFYFVFTKGKASLKRAMWYNKKGHIKEQHDYNVKGSNKFLINIFKYYNDFGVLVRTERNIYNKQRRFIRSEVDTDFTQEQKILSPTIR